MMFNQNNDHLCAMQGYKNKQTEGGVREGGGGREGGRERHTQGEGERDTHTHTGRDGEAGRGRDRQGGSGGRQISGVWKYVEQVQNWQLEPHL